MAKFKYLGISALTFMLLASKVTAAECDYKEKAKLNSEVANVKTNYEIKERTLSPGEYEIPDSIKGTELEATYVAKTDYIQVNILNITENMYAVVSNEEGSFKRTFNYSNVRDGVITFDWQEINDVQAFTVKVYASNKTSCEGSVLKTLYITLPRYNEYSTYSICSEIPNYYLCQKYITSAEIPYEDFINKVSSEVNKEYKEEEEKKLEESKWYRKVGKFIKNNKVIFITGGIGIVTVAGVATVIIIRKRRRSVI